MARGWLPVYAALWLQCGAPLAAIRHTLEETLDEDPFLQARLLGRPPA